MSTTATDTGASPAPKNLLARVVGIIFSPGETYKSIVAHPHWLGMLVLTTLVSTFCTVLPMTTPEGKQAYVDAAERRLEGFGMDVTDQMHEAMVKSSERAAYTTSATIIVMAPVISVIVAGILFGVFGALMGGSARFKQVYSVVVHAGVISTISALFTGPVNYFRGSMDSVTNLGALLPMLSEKSFAARFAGMLDVFLIWWVVVLSIGLAVLYRRQTRPIATTLLAVYGGIALIVALVMSRLGGA